MVEPSTTTAMPPLRALELASLGGARFVGIERDVGSITVGKLADLMVLNRNPLDNIRTTTDIAYVMKAGRLWDAKTLDEVWPSVKPFGEPYWASADPRAARGAGIRP